VANLAEPRVDPAIGLEQITAADVLLSKQRRVSSGREPSGGRTVRRHSLWAAHDGAGLAHHQAAGRSAGSTRAAARTLRPAAARWTQCGLAGSARRNDGSRSLGARVCSPAVDHWQRPSADLGPRGVGRQAALARPVLSRRKDLGRQRALGARRSTVIALVAARTGAATTLGSAMGLVAGLAYLAISAGELPQPSFSAGLFILAILAPSLASVLPAWWAAQRDPVLELRTP